MGIREDKIALTTEILSYCEDSGTTAAVESFSNLKDTIGLVVSLCGYRRTFWSLKCIWECIGAAEISVERNENYRTFKFVDVTMDCTIGEWPFLAPECPHHGTPDGVSMSMRDAANGPFGEWFLEVLPDNITTIRLLMRNLEIDMLEQKRMLRDACLLLEDLHALIVYDPMPVSSLTGYVALSVSVVADIFEDESEVAPRALQQWSLKKTCEEAMTYGRMESAGNSVSVVVCKMEFTAAGVIHFLVSWMQTII